MALPAGFLDELRARTPLAPLISRKVKLARSGRQWKGCCPFHGEKTPSFHVYDDHFHCFGCGAHGDAVSFVMQSQGASFPEAVAQLAAEAGMEVPRPSERDAEAEQRRLDLHAVLEAAAASYRRRLRLPDGARALAYLRERGLTEETIDAFGLGWSGEGRGALLADLSRDGITAEQLIDAGLMRPGDEGRPPYDLFFNRVMFPIRDRRGRVVSFGGRIMGDGQPKYVNGPETDLFSKRRTLFALDLAREGLRGNQDLIVVEGYMDVIALHQAGFTGAVAPLGTALTEEQLELLWQLSPMPVLCFDGDAAGGRAASRALELALPFITSERSLKVAMLEGGDDPDSLVRKGGREKLADTIANARSFADALFLQVRGMIGDSTPELRANLSKTLDSFAGRIADPALGWEYKKALRGEFRRQYGGAKKKSGGSNVTQRLVSFVRPSISGSSAAAERGRHLVAILLRHPDLLHDVGEAFGSVMLPPGLARLRDAILSWGGSAEALDSAALMTHLHSVGLAAEAAQALSVVPAPLAACASPDAMPAEAEAGWWHFFGLMNPAGLEEQVSVAMREWRDRPDDTTQRRLVTLVEARNALARGELGGEA